MATVTAASTQPTPSTVRASGCRYLERKSIIGCTEMRSAGQERRSRMVDGTPREHIATRGQSERSPHPAVRKHDQRVDSRLIRGAFGGEDVTTFRDRVEAERALFIRALA